MKHKFLTVLPSMFSFRQQNNYDDFVVRGGATEMMRSSWVRVGHQLSDSMEKVAKIDALEKSKDYYIVYAAEFGHLEKKRIGIKCLEAVESWDPNLKETNIKKID